MDRRRAAGALLALAACVAYATAAPTASNHTSLDLYDNGTPDGCYYNFQHYGEGDRIMTNEPCLNCTCHNRMLMCYLRVCPFTKPIGQDCTIEKRADQCCPIVTCPDVPVDLLTSTTTSPAEYGATGLGKLDKYGCSIHGKYFPEGSKVPPAPNKPCEHCYCIRNMTTCVMQECTLHVDGCTPIYHKDVCCPVRYSCDHPEDEMPLLDDLSTTVRPTPGFLLTTTTLSPVTQITQDCIYENQVIPDGALIKTEKACDHCYCMKGDIVCVVQECGTPMENEGKNCTALAPREGVCCPDTYICEGDEPTTGTYGGADYTTELEQEAFTTLSPPRRTGSEGSGYRHEPGYTPPASLASDIDVEGSGDGQTTIIPTIFTEDLPESHKVETSGELLTSTEKLYEITESISTKAPVSAYDSVTSESDKYLENKLQQNIPSTTSNYISQQTELLTTKSYDDELGSGEEDIITSHDTIPTSSLPEIDENIASVTGDISVTTTDSSREDHLTTRLLEPSTNAPLVEVEKTAYPEEKISETTTESHHHEDKATYIPKEDHPTTELDTLRTTIVPSTEDDVGKTTVSLKQDTTIPNETKTTKTFDEQHHVQTSTYGVNLDDEAVTTESQDVISNKFGETESDVDTYHQTTMTASTPLLEEIEKDTDQESMHVQVTHVEDEPTTTTKSSNIYTQESIDKDSLKPDIIDEIIPTNIPTTISTNEDEDITTVEPQSNQDLEYSLEPVHETQKTTPEHSFTTNAPEKSDGLDNKVSSQSEQYASTTSVPDEIKEITAPATNSQNESSETQQYSLSTSSSVFENEIKQTTITETTIKPEIYEENSESHKHYPTTSASNIDNEHTSSDFETITQRIHENEVEDISESHEYASTTTLSDERKDLPTDKIPKLDHEEADDNVSKPQQSDFTTNVPSLQDTMKKTTLSDDTIIATSDSQKDQGVDTIEVTSEALPYSSTKVFDDKIEEITQANAHDEAHIVTIPEHKEITTAEPDKGLNTIPSGPIDEEITESSETGKYSHAPEVVTELSTVKESELSLSVQTETITETDKYTTTLIPDTSVSREDQLLLTTESSQNDNIESIVTTKTNDNIERTTIPTEISKEDISSSTSVYSASSNSPTTEYHEMTPTVIPSISEQTTETTEASKYGSYSTSSELDTSMPVKHESETTPSPSYISETTIPNTENIQISNEPRIPGEGDCLLNGVTYRNESVVPSSNKCQSGCYCSSSIIKCDPIICSPPPEYMDNCETTYDSSDSCCPTYVCDHRRTETMPPQSHSQMSGTDTPFIPPVKCNGVECVNREDEKPILCDSGNCSLQDESSATETIPAYSEGTEKPLESPIICSGDKCKTDEKDKPTLCDTTGSCSPQDGISPAENVPEQPISSDHHDECSGNDCKVSGSTEQLCTKENGCVMTPVKPCEGTECTITSDVIPPQKCDGDNCDLSVTVCNDGICDSKQDNLQQEPVDIEKECTEKSCKRKDDHKTEQHPPQNCSGSECPLSVASIEQTTPVNLGTTQHEFDEQSKSTDNLDTATETIEKSSNPPSTLFDISSISPIDEITRESGHHDTNQSDNNSEQLSTTQKPDATITYSDRDSDVITDHVPVTDKSDKVFTDKISTETPLHSSDMDITEEQDITTDFADQKHTVIMNMDATTAIINNENDITTEQQSSKSQTKIPEYTHTSISEGVSYTEPSDSSTLPSKIQKPQDVSQKPVDRQPEEITTELNKVTELPLLEKEEESVTKMVEEITSTPLKSYDEDVSGATDITKDIASLDMTTQAVNIDSSDTKLNDEFNEITKAPEHPFEETTFKSTDEMIQSTQFSEEILNPTTVKFVPEKSDITKSQSTTQEIQEITTEISKSSDPHINKEIQYTKESDVFESTPSTVIEVTTQENKEKQSTAADVEKYTESPEVTEVKTTQAFETSQRDEHTIIPEKEEKYTTRSYNTDEAVTETANLDISDVSNTKSPQFFEIEKTTVKITSEAFDDTSKYDELLYSTFVPQKDSVKYTTVSNIIAEAGTEPSKLDGSEKVSTTKAADSYDSEKMTSKATTETYTDFQTITQTLQDVSNPIEDKHQSSSDSQLPEQSTTFQPEIVYESTTSPISELDSKITHTEQSITHDFATQNPEQSKPTEMDTELTTEPFIRTTMVSITPMSNEVVASTRDQEVTTESSLHFVTKAEQDFDVFGTSEKSNVDSEKPEIDFNNLDSKVTGIPIEKETAKPEQSDDITLKPVNTSTSEDSALEDNAKTEIPEMIKTTLQSDDDVTNKIVTKTELQESTAPSNEGLLDESTVTISIIETTTKPGQETKLPVDLEFVTETQTSKNPEDATSPSETSIKETSESIDSSGIKISEDDGSTTKTPEKEEKLSEKPIEISDISTNPPESEQTVPETSTTSLISSEPVHNVFTPQVADKEASKLTTDATTVFTDLPTEPSGFIDETKTESSQGEPSKPEVTEQTKVESSPSIDDTEDKIHTTAPETSSIQETSSSADNLLQLDVKENATELPEEKLITKEPVITDTERIHEVVTEFEEVKTPKPEQSEASPAHTTEFVELITKVHAQENDENIDIATKYYDQTTAAITETTIETSTKLSEIEASQLSSSTVKYQDSELKTTSKYEYFETTTSAKIGDENVVSVNTDKPILDNDQQIIPEVTESQSVLMDTATTKQEDLVTSKTTTPEMHLTTSFELEKTTIAPDVIDEASAAPEQTSLSSIKPQVYEDSESLTTVVSDDKISSTTIASEDDGHTETVIEATQKPFPHEPSPETSVSEEQPTTAKTDEIPTVSPMVENVTKQPYKPEISATEQPKPIPSEDQATDNLGQDEEPSMPPSGTTGYGTDPDYMEEDQTFGPGTCRYGGKVYVSAQQIPRDDPCDFCFCFRSDIICLQQSCPPPIHGCHEEPISGFCCPRYECPVSMATTVNVTTTTTTTTTTLPPHFPVHSYKGSAQKRGCLIKGHTYKVGEIVRASSGPCLHCTCGGDGQMKCDPKQCTPEPMLRQMIAAAVSAKRRR